MSQGGCEFIIGSVHGEGSIEGILLYGRLCSHQNQNLSVRHLGAFSVPQAITDSG